MQQKIATGKSSFYFTRSYIVLQNTSNDKIYDKEQLQQQVADALPNFI